MRLCPWVIPGSQHITIGGALALMLMVNHWHQSSIASCCEELNVMISGTVNRCNREIGNQLF